MDYSFEIVGVSPILSFFQQQQTQTRSPSGAEYLGSYQCTLDAFLESLEDLPPRRGWHLDQVVDSVINFWLHNGDRVTHWKQRLADAGAENLLVARVADLESLKTEFEFLLGQENS